MVQYIYYFLAKIETPVGLPQTEADGRKIKAALQVLFILLGSVSLLMVTIGGFKYAISQGEQTAIRSAKNTILYAVIGLVVSLSAWAIVTFVLQGIF
jgi:uncharacterized membrane protein YidH (DUF202 family)